MVEMTRRASLVKWGGIALAVVAALIVWHMAGSSQHFVCRGVITENATKNSRPSGEISLRFEVTPALNRKLFGSEDYGLVAMNVLDQQHLLLTINHITASNVFLSREGVFGMFDRISRRLVLNDGLQAYDLICRETRPAKI
jgi:hypothetical protein